MLLTLICFAGVVLIIQPGFLFERTEEEFSISWLLPILTAFMTSISYIYLHKLKDQVPNMVSLHYFIICQNMLAGVLQTLFIPPSPEPEQPF